MYQWTAAYFANALANCEMKSLVNVLLLLLLINLGAGAEGVLYARRYPMTDDNDDATDSSAISVMTHLICAYNLAAQKHLVSTSQTPAAGRGDGEAVCVKDAATETLQKEL